MNIQTSILIISCSLLTLGCSSKTERDFLSGCQSAGMERSACECVYEKLEKNMEKSISRKIFTPSARRKHSSTT